MAESPQVATAAELHTRAPRLKAPTDNVYEETETYGESQQGEAARGGSREPAHAVAEISTAAIPRARQAEQQGRRAQPQNTPQRSTDAECRTAEQRSRDSGTAGRRTAAPQNTATEYTAAERTQQNARQENTGFTSPQDATDSMIAFRPTIQAMRLAAEQRRGTVGHRETGRRPKPKHYGNPKSIGIGPLRSFQRGLVWWFLPAPLCRERRTCGSYERRGCRERGEPGEGAAAEPPGGEPPRGL
jgi:hypothetical protein